MLNEILHIAAIPLDVAPADKEGNLNAVEDALKQLPEEVDVVVLPELFSTGFIADIDALIDLSEPVSGATIQRLLSLAKKYQVAFVGTFLARVGGQLCNRAFFLEPSGDETYYDKTHLFGISQESKLLSRGESAPPIVRYRGWNIAMVVCYELRFPVWCRNRHNEYDVLLIPANWPESRAYAWRQLLSARAIENQAYVVGADRGGEDQFGVYPAELTEVYDFQGRPIATHTSQGVAIAALDHRQLDEYRKRMPVSDDADDFNVNLKKH